MGHRECRRVPLDFNWPLGKVWGGYLRPSQFSENDCPDCKSGYSPRAQILHDQWYGYAPFDPGSTGSSSLTHETPAVRAFAERNVSRSPEFYGSGEAEIAREARRLAAMWNTQWCHHLSADDVDALVAGGRLMDFTHTWSREDGWKPKNPPAIPAAAQVNEWSILGFGHDSINCHVVIQARCKREGVSDTCPTCGGHGSVEAYAGQRAAGEAWTSTEPPTGEGWQLWETTSEGSPKSPVFASAELLADWCAGNATIFASEKTSRENWLRMFKEDGGTDVGSMAVLAGGHFGAAVNIEGLGEKG